MTQVHLLDVAFFDPKPIKLVRSMPMATMSRKKDSGNWNDEMIQLTAIDSLLIPVSYSFFYMTSST